MNAIYPVREGANRSILLLLVAAVLMASLFLAIRVVDQPVVVKFGNPAAISAGQAVPQVMPVPEPAQNQPAPYTREGATPVPPGAQVSPAPQPVLMLMPPPEH